MFPSGRSATTAALLLLGAATAVAPPASAATRPTHATTPPASAAIPPTHATAPPVRAIGYGAYYGRQDLGELSPGRLVDPARPGLSCAGPTGAPFTSADDTHGTGEPLDLPSGCVDVVYGAQRMWDMLRHWFGRDGVDGSGRTLPARVGVTAPGGGGSVDFGYTADRRRQTTTLDTIGHEYGHAIFRYTPGGAGGGIEAGGLAESAGDILGALTEHYADHPADPPDYEVGELLDVLGRGPIRYMYEPSKVGDPNCMWTGSAPEVHKGAGPQNHWFYLLAEGSNPTNGQPKSPTCNNSTLTGIGIQKAGQIFMGALSRKTPGWTHAKARAATVAAAAELFPGGPECAATRRAWDAVAVPGPDTCP
ncbi:hypothetical protein GCM10010123_25360 [Pilimelia anulata]|uniref:Neutral metalloproteinase n=1 Tax=Pilimelia anulata TaxID=53371 RepID=A0A8J3B950_9ACTN|nr:M4 family metallopeptidase [Pilimelia anulata]GGJ94431.1 hypothetical protein GCM10010123_25360 [Pilimelia anulata]